MSRQTQVIIHADAILNNFKLLAALSPTSRSIAVIKADAYGHGAVNVARILKYASSRFVVAIMEEAIALREAGVTAPIVVLEGAHQQKECALAQANNCILVMHNRQQLGWVKACEPTCRPHIWLKVDSGMHRLGFTLTELPAIIRDYADLLTDETVLATHLACADQEDSAFTEQQIESFSQLAKAMALPVSIANSPATITWPSSRGDWNRLGIGIYGGQPQSRHISLAPTMTLRSSIIALRHVPKGESVGYGQNWVAPKDSQIATVGIGYADGYPRHCPNGTPVAINGVIVPLAGRVSMDMITVDVTDLPQVNIGDRVELWGEHVPISEVAAAAGTIDYELMTRVSARVPRMVKYR